MAQKNTHQSWILAKAALDACVSSVGIVAGAHHFVDLWARDSLFATFGANVSGRAQVSKKTIETFLSFQRQDGLIPYLVQRSRLSIGKYLFGKNSYFASPVPAFRSHQSGGVVPDGGLMSIIASRNYAEATGDDAFLHANYVTLQRALNWYENKFAGDLIREWFLCEWADAILKVGKTLYTNVLYWKATGDLSWIAKRLKKSVDAHAYAQQQQRLGETMHQTFWTGSYFADWVDWRRQDYFAAHPNMLAIIFGLADEAQSRKILDSARPAWQHFTLINSLTTYPFWRIPVHHYAMGVPDYHNGMRWLQPGIAYTIALKKAGFENEARTQFAKIGAKIIEYNGVFEVYEKNGMPVRRRWYTSEHPFAWSAGLFLWAVDFMRN